MTNIKTADGLCVLHYGRKRRVGSLQVSLYKKPWLTPGEILWDRSEPHGDCILWTGCLTHDGYGSLGPSWIYSKAHRVSWFLVHGEIADGIEIDHLCHNRDLDCMPATCVHRRCINPDHLEAVSHDENMRRQFARVA